MYGKSGLVLVDAAFRRELDLRDRVFLRLDRELGEERQQGLGQVVCMRSWPAGATSPNRVKTTSGVNCARIASCS